MQAQGAKKSFKTDPALFQRTPFVGWLDGFQMPEFEKIVAFGEGAKSKFSKSKKGGWGVGIPWSPAAARGNVGPTRTGRSWNALGANWVCCGPTPRPTSRAMRRMPT